LTEHKHLEADKSLMKRIGIVLVILSFVLYGGLFAVPFIPCSAATKAIISTLLIISGEVSFWIGGIILGKEFVSKFRSYFNPMKWLKKPDYSLLFTPLSAFCHVNSSHLFMITIMIILPTHNNGILPGLCTA
jgi:hypothetical protein